MARAAIGRTRRPRATGVATLARAAWFKAKGKRPVNLAHGRWFGDFGDLSEAERKLVRDCGRGVYCGFGEGSPEFENYPDATAHRDELLKMVTRPEESNPSNTIRAQLLRFLILGGDGDHPLHEGGIQIVGAWITGELDISVSSGAGYLGFYSCHFDSPVIMDYAKLPLIVFTGSFMPKLSGLCLRIDGNVYLDTKFETIGGVDLTGAQIGGSLSCSGGIFQHVDEEGNPSGIALSASLAQITGNIGLNDGFVAKGEVQFIGSRIEGAMSLTNGKFQQHPGDGKSFTGALNAEGMTVKGGMIVRDARFDGLVNLLDVSTSSLTDDLESWPSGSLILDGFRYDRILFASTEAVDRIEWLKKQRDADLGEDFRPQPWEHLIKVLRDMGHPNQAKLVAIEKQRALLRAKKVGPRPPKPEFDRNMSVAYNLHQAADWIAYPADLAGSGIRRLAHIVYGSFGYGHRPFRIVGLILLVLVGLGFAYQGLGLDNPQCFNPRGMLKPPASCPHDLSLPWRYSADMILPLDFGLFDKGQPVPTSVGVPAANKDLTIALSWGETFFGWLFSGLLLAIAGRLIQRD